MISKLLIANRGEIAIRISRAASELGIETVAIFSADDAASLHTQKADEAHQLDGSSAGAYLDSAQIIEVAKRRGCDAIHPGYGFLSENPEFAKACSDEGIVFVLTWSCVPLNVILFHVMLVSGARQNDVAHQ